MSLRTFVIVYIVGGLTFIPLLALSIFAFAYFTLPRVQQQARKASISESGAGSFKDGSTPAEDDGFVDDHDATAAGTSDAAGYFAVCREYVPGGINGKPPERSSPAGEMLNSESPSVYQSMYRSIFERNKTQAPSVDGDKKDNKAVKRPRNVFFVVLRHDHLLLFDNADQVEIRHVISLLHHTVDIYGGGEVLVEGDLWIKKNCIRLTRRALAGNPGPTSQPFYIFSDNCSEKEDFYHALLQAQSNAISEDAPPRPRQIPTDDMITLIQALHKSDKDPHCRWLNAMIGRVFLSVYKTKDIQALVKAKIDRKISRVPKPNFISSIQVDSVDMGTSAPMISNPKLKEMMVDGSLTLEMDIKYSGSIRLQIAAVARIELGSRIRAREVDLVLAGVLRKLSGHLLVRVKPPPSNRLWISFETPPQLDLAVEPVVSSMQITYSVILRAIESRIREVISETVVLPNWDDVPFFDTLKHGWRGGIWEDPKKDKKDTVTGDTASEVITTDSSEKRTSTSKTDDEVAELEDLDRIPPLSTKTMSMPSLVSGPATKHVTSRKPVRKPVAVTDSEGHSTSMSTNSTPASPSRSKPTSPRATPADKPRVMRSNSFASAATPLVSIDDAIPSTHRSPGKNAKAHREAVDLVKEVKSRSDSMSAQMQNPLTRSRSSSIDDDIIAASQKVDELERTVSDEGDGSSPTTSSAPNRSATVPIPDSTSKAKPWNFGTSPPAGSALERATATAKNWGINMMNRQTGSVKKSVTGFTSLAKEAGLEESSEAAGEDMSRSPSKNGDKGDKDRSDTSGSAADREKQKAPVGRGQPLPPAGTPLPGPKSSLWSTSNLNLGSFKRKPVTNPPVSAEHFVAPTNSKEESQVLAHHHRRTSSAVSNEQTAPTTSSRRKSSAAGSSRGQRNTHRHSQQDPASSTDDVITVPAPSENESSEQSSASESDGTSSENATAPPPLPARPSKPLTLEREISAEETDESGTETGTIDTNVEDEPVDQPESRKETVKIKTGGASKGGWHVGAAVGEGVERVGGIVKSKEKEKGD